MTAAAVRRETRQEIYERDQREWIATSFEALTTRVVVLKPSEWAEKYRYLPPQVTPAAGQYRFEVTPYLREIVDCFDIDSPVTEVALMKGVQVGATVGVLENVIGYLIAHVKNAPVMMVTADSDLAKLRMESYITPMLHYSELMHLIKSADETNSRKSGKTDSKLEWYGGGFLIPFGAQNANKLRSVSIRYLLNDEIDGWPDVVGNDGDPIKLVHDRTAVFEAIRKIFYTSTPLIKGQSKIDTQYRRGDQRKYFVKCLRCEHAQVLRWSRTDSTTGVVTGIRWDMANGRLVPGSTRYLCEHCAHPHTEEDKVRLFAPANAEWRPTAEPIAPNVRSYHLSALYSPAGMQSWEACVQKWLEAWDVENNRPIDLDKLQVFYNNVLGETFELRGEKLRFENVSAHRRHEYKFGQVPNVFAAAHCGGPVLILTCAVDVQKDHLKVGVFGWCRDRRAVLIDYHTLEGDPEQPDDPGTWGRLRDIIEDAEYVADDGKHYRVEIAVIDSGYLTDHVYNFCADYPSGVYPVKGQSTAPRSVRVPEFTQFTTTNGITAYGITVDLYKDRWSAALRRGWDGTGIQPIGHFNAPIDTTDKQLKELTAEVKREKIEKSTGKRIGFEWHRAGANELWDLVIYNNAALDLMAWHFSQEQEFEFTSWPAFWDACQDEKLYFTE